MKLSYNWLKELLPDLSATPHEVAEKLTMHAFETTIASQFVIDPTIRVVSILKIEPHPQADRLRLAIVTDGTQEIRLVCGAPNIVEGQCVPLAPPGANVYDSDGQTFTIKEAVIRGQASPGMLASARELGLGSDHGGIFVLPADTPLGSHLADHISSDTIFEAEVTPNRAHDSLSHVGVARELGALFGVSVHESTAATLPAATTNVAGFTVAIENAVDTPRYMNVVLQGATARSSPVWLQARLLSLGVRPINAIVDSTNYVLLESGQPSHAFDAKKMPGKITGVRRVNPGEQLALLDGQTIEEVPTDALVITSDDVPVALAGIMGGAGTEVEEGTHDLILEVANFHPYTIAHAATAASIRTEAATRFAKGISPNLVAAAAARLVFLLQELAHATVVGVVDQYPEKWNPRVISFSPERVGQVAGTTVTAKQAEDALVRLRCMVDTTSEPWSVTVPPDRLDLEGEHDLVEEVIRLAGLAAIPTRPFPAPATRPQQPVAVEWRETLRDTLVARGFAETYNISFEPETLAALFAHPVKRVEISNPLAPEQAGLRTSLLPGLVANFITNKDDFHKKFTHQTRALFEIGHVFERADDLQSAVPGIREEEHLAGMLVGTGATVSEVLTVLQKALGVELDDTIVLFAGELPADVLAKMKYRVPVAAFELNATALYKQLPEVAYIPRTVFSAAPYQEFSRYPSVLRDISFLVESSVTADQAQELLERVGGELVVDTELFDEFLPAELAGTPPLKGLAFHIEYQALDRTLTATEVEVLHNRIIKALETELGAQVR